ncbi:uncharacterized protein LOC121788594 [Salvia splendens]|uniref:uncharacterized protein LOC121788594 n=1 Tax=Salvia splendens TaxID=180675 RepID=UPI001C2612F9|nr:uncharacterized protein LOC121788594 [Salvia splendens]
MSEISAGFSLTFQLLTPPLTPTVTLLNPESKFHLPQFSHFPNPSRRRNTAETTLPSPATIKFKLTTRSAMTKRGMPIKSQPTQAAASKQLRLDINEAVDDILLVGIAQKFRERLSEAGTSTSPKETEDRKPRGRNVDHLYCRRTPTEFLNCIKSLTLRQKEAVRNLYMSLRVNAMFEHYLAISMHYLSCIMHH